MTTLRCSTAALFLALLGLACGPSGGGTTSLSGGTGGEAEGDEEVGDGDVGASADSTTGPPFEPGTPLCEPTESQCQDPADCCPAVQAASAFIDDKHTCPSSIYPNDWSCVYDQQLGYNVCVNAGCTSNAECGNMSFAQMICRVIEEGGPALAAVCLMVADMPGGYVPTGLDWIPE